MRRLLLRASLIALAAALGACANPFLGHYKGVRCPPVNTAHVSVAAPVDATLIGTSDFVTEIAPGMPEVIAAAERVGADIVQWDRALQRHEVPLLQASLAGDGLAPSSSPHDPAAVEGTWYRIHARFWRSNALGGFPPPPAAPAVQAPPADTGDPPARSDASPATADSVPSEAEASAPPVAP